MAIHEYDFSEDWRVYPDANGDLLLPDLWDPDYHRIIVDAEGTWDLRWLSEQHEQTSVGVFDTPDEAVHAALGAPVDLASVGTVHPYMTMTVRPASCDPEEFRIVVRQCGGPFPWEAVVDTQERWPKHAYGSTCQEAIARLFGVEELAGDDPAYAFMED